MTDCYSGVSTSEDNLHKLFVEAMAMPKADFEMVLDSSWPLCASWTCVCNVARLRCFVVVCFCVRVFCVCVCSCVACSGLCLRVFVDLGRSRGVLRLRFSGPIRTRALGFCITQQVSVFVVLTELQLLFLYVNVHVPFSLSSLLLCPSFYALFKRNLTTSKVLGWVVALLGDAQTSCIKRNRSG